MHHLTSIDMFFLIMGILILINLIKFLYHFVLKAIVIIQNIVIFILNMMDNLNEWSNQRNARKAKKEYRRYQERSHSYDANKKGSNRCNEQEKYLKLLGLDSNASKDDVKRAYYRLAQKYHPDKYRIEKDKIKYTKIFIDIKEAYEYLSR